MEHRLLIWLARVSKDQKLVEGREGGEEEGMGGRGRGGRGLEGGSFGKVVRPLERPSNGAQLAMEPDGNVVL